ncbi:MAG: hypothetical protein GF387_02125 [Candidatus Portnoybacteria bacterium]|nr:hypothetical protein [Candidatus Portnoybacteria bacterium]
MNDKGLKLAVLYSYGCPGSRVQKHNDLFLNFLKGKEKDKEKVKNAIESLFNSAFYKIIGAQIEKDQFDEETARLYWTGIPEKELIQSNGLCCFHNFTVLGAIHRNPNIEIEKIDDCKISVARIKEIKDKITVFHYSLIKKEDDTFQIAERSTSKEIEKGFVKKENLKEDVWITYHWNIAREALKEEQAICLLRKTKEAINLFNQKN